MNLDGISLKTGMFSCSKCGKEYEGQLAVFNEKPLYPPRCPECHKESDAAVERATEIARLADLAARRREWREHCGIPKKYQAQDLGTFDGTRGNTGKVLAKCKSYADGFPLDYDGYLRQGKSAYPSLVIQSDNWGVGKSHLAAGIAHRILDRWQNETSLCPVRFVSEPEIYERIQASYNAPKDASTVSEQQILGQLTFVSLLVIDDLGKQPRRDMDFVRRTLFAIIDRRYTRMKPVVITTNKDAKGLRQYLGGGDEKQHIPDDEAIMSRLIEMTGGVFDKIVAPDFRRR